MKNYLLFFALQFNFFYLLANEDSAKFLKNIEILAIRNNDKTPMTFITLEKDFLDKNNSTQDLPFVLQKTPSLVSFSDAGNGVGYTGLRMRGSDLTRINITLNGVPYNDPESQNVFFVNIPNIANIAQSIQIQRGVGTSSNGGSAFGGTINISTLKNVIDTLPSISIASVLGSFNTQKIQLNASTGLIHKKLNVDFATSYTQSDGYIQRAKTNLTSFYTSFQYLFNSRLNFTFNYIYGNEKTYHAWNGVIDTLLNKNRTFNSAGLIINGNGTIKNGLPYENQTDNYQQQHFQGLFSFQVNSNLFLQNTLFTILGKGYFEEYRNDDITSYQLPNFAFTSIIVSPVDLIRRLHLQNVFYGNLFSLNFIKTNYKIHAGLNIQLYDGRHFGELLWVDKFPTLKDASWYDFISYKNDINSFVKFQYEGISNFSLYADFQIRRVHYELNGFEKNPTRINSNHLYFFMNPKFGIFYNKKNYKAFVSYAIAQREPNRVDFENNLGKLPQPEFLQDIEFGNTFKLSDFKITNVLFAMFYKDQLVQNGTIDNLGNYLRQNVENSYRIGSEFDVSYAFNSALNFQANLTYSINKITDYEFKIFDYDKSDYQTTFFKETDIAFSPNLVSAYDLDYTYKNFNIALKGKYVGKQYIDNTSNEQRSLNAFFTQDVAFRYSFTKNHFNSFIELQLNNVLNTVYEPNAYMYAYISGNQLYSNNYYFPAAGINFNVKWSATIK